MRRTIWLSLIALCLIAAGIHHQTAAQPGPVPGPKQFRMPKEGRREGRVPAPVNLQGDKTWPSWKVESGWKVTQDEAVQDALDRAQATVVAEYLGRQNPPLEWQPPAEFIRGYLLKDVSPADKFQDEESKEIIEIRVGGHLAREEVKNFGDPLGTMYRVCLRVGIPPGSQSRILQEEKTYQAQQRQVRAQQRQFQLAQVLVGVVALLTAIAGYLRLEDATKGYYTKWLRLAAVIFLGLVGAGIWMMS